MGLLNEKCCRYKANEESLQSKMNEPRLSKLPTKDLNESSSVNSVPTENKKRVTFSNLIEQRNLHCCDEKEYENVPYEDIQKEPRQLGNDTEELITNISFENSENYFVIEDCFYKHSHKLPKSIAELKIKGSAVVEHRLNAIINLVKEIANRIDGLIFYNNNLVVLTEFLIVESSLDKETSEFNKKLSIKEIDYITMTRDGKKIILHLIGNRTYVITNVKLQKVVSCICSSYLFGKYTIDRNNKFRQIPVIVLNEKFPVINELESISNFNDFKQIVNSFIIKKLNEMGYILDEETFKYASVKTRKEMIVFSSDMIITKGFILLLEYTSESFKIIHKVLIGVNFRIKCDNKNRSLKIYDKLLNTKGIEIFTESYSSIFNLIAEIINKKRKK